MSSVWYKLIEAETGEENKTRKIDVTSDCIVDKVRNLIKGDNGSLDAIDAPELVVYKNRSCFAGGCPMEPFDTIEVTMASKDKPLLVWVPCRFDEEDFLDPALLQARQVFLETATKSLRYDL